jgi:mannosyltransferase
MLYVLTQLLPLAVWTLRLPSLLAGVGCVWAMNRLGQRLGGARLGLLAALFTAIDPMQIAVSSMARPYALGNLVCVLSFLCLFRLAKASRPVTTREGLEYGLTLAGLAYLNPVLLLVGVAHLGVIAFALIAPFQGGNPTWADRLTRLTAWFSGCAIAGLLLWPQTRYIQEVAAFNARHGEYLRCFGAPRLVFFLWHNSAFLLALFLGLLLLFAGRSHNETPGQKTGLGHEALALGLSWLLLPQIAAGVVFWVKGQSVCLSRYLSYTALGGAVLLGYLVSRIPSSSLRIGGAAVLTLSILMLDATSIERQFKRSYLLTDTSLSLKMAALRQREREGEWQEGDVLLVRAGMLEGDFLEDFTTETRHHVEQALIAPLLTTEAGTIAKPVFVLTMSQRGPQTSTTLGGYLPSERAGLAKLGVALRPYRRFWILSQDWDREAYLRCFLPRLAQGIGCRLKHSESNGISLVERLPPGGTSLQTPSSP